MNAYELAREETIKSNQRRLAQLGVAACTAQLVAACAEKDSAVVNRANSAAKPDKPVLPPRQSFPRAAKHSAVAGISACHSIEAEETQNQALQRLKRLQRKVSERAVRAGTSATPMSTAKDWNELFRGNLGLKRHPSVDAVAQAFADQGLSPEMIAGLDEKDAPRLCEQLVESNMGREDSFALSFYRSVLQPLYKGHTAPSAQRTGLPSVIPLGPVPCSHQPNKLHLVYVAGHDDCLICQLALLSASSHC